MSASGIYAIARKDSDECYIGSAVNVANRWRNHQYSLRHGKHDSPRMQNVFNKHGADVFAYVILEPVADKAKLIEREQAWLDAFSPAYNTAKVAGSCLGTKRTDECKARMSAFKTGKKHTPEQNAAQSARRTGEKRSPEVCAAISARNTGRKHSAETRARISADKTGKKRAPFTPEHCAALSAGKTGTKRTAAHRANMSAAQQKRRADERTKKAAA